MSLEQSQHARNAFWGAGLSLIAAYGFVVVSGLIDIAVRSRWLSFDPIELFVGGPAFALAFTFWIVIPIGGVLGSVIPWLVRKQSPFSALLIGIGFGVLIGLLCASVGAYMISNVESFSSDGPPDIAKWWLVFWRQFASLAPLLSVYSSMWTAGYAFMRAGKDQAKGVLARSRS